MLISMTQISHNLHQSCCSMTSRMEKCKPYVGQVFIQISYAGMNIMARLALKHGMNHFVLVTYRQAIATLAIAPFVYFLERKRRPPLTWSILFHIFLLACGITISQNCYFQGVYYTSSTFGSAAMNVIPIITFVMATFVRLEEIHIRSLGGQAKIVGTIVCVSGAMVMTLYKGPSMRISSSSQQLPNSNTAPSSKYEHNNMVLGSILVYGGLVAWSAWLTFQGPVTKRYPAHLSLTILTCLFSALQSAVLCIICEHEQWKVWAIPCNIQLVSVVYTGIICSAMGFFIQAWCIQKKGPVFAGVFSPVCTLSTAFLEFIIFHLPLHVGSVLGAVLIIMGLYCALWGKSKDRIKMSTADASTDSEDPTYHYSQQLDKEGTEPPGDQNPGHIQKRDNSA